MEILSKEFVPYDLAIQLKELGFDEPCFGEYRQWDGYQPYLQLYQDLDQSDTSPFTIECKSPTFSQAFKWFREKHNLIGGIEYIAGQTIKTTWWDIYVVGHYNTKHKEMEMKYQPFEDAELACIRKLISLVKEKTNEN